MVENSSAAEANDVSLLVLERFSDAQLVSLPRYDKFGASVRGLVDQGVRFREIAGNRRILVSAIVPADWRPEFPSARTMLSEPILTDPSRKRVGLSVPVSELHSVLPAIERGGARFEHLYDY
jgi:hypothetical protein